MKRFWWMFVLPYVVTVPTQIPDDCSGYLICALALPGLPQTQFNDYNLLREYLEAKYPEYDVFYIAEGEELMMKNAEWTPLTHEGLRIWTLPRRAA